MKTCNLFYFYRIVPCLKDFFSQWHNTLGTKQVLDQWRCLGHDGYSSQSPDRGGGAVRGIWAEGGPCPSVGQVAHTAECPWAESCVISDRACHVSPYSQAAGGGAASLKQGVDVSECLSSKPVSIPELARKRVTTATHLSPQSSLSPVHLVSRAKNLPPSLQVIQAMSWSCWCQIILESVLRGWPFGRPQYQSVWKR